MPFGYQQPGPGNGLFVLLMLLLGVVLVVWVVVTLTRHGDHPHPHHTHHGDHGATGSPRAALTILNERFARGEIDAEEFTMRRDLLRGSS